MESVSGLLEREAFVVFSLAKVWRCLLAVALGLNVFEKCFVAAVNALHDILDCLTAEAIPKSIALTLLDLCDVFLKRIRRQALTI